MTPEAIMETRVYTKMSVWKRDWLRSVHGYIHLLICEQQADINCDATIRKHRATLFRNRLRYASSYGAFVPLSRFDFILQQLRTSMPRSRCVPDRSFRLPIPLNRTEPTETFP